MFVKGYFSEPFSPSEDEWLPSETERLSDHTDTSVANIIEDEASTSQENKEEDEIEQEQTPKRRRKSDPGQWKRNKEKEHRKNSKKIGEMPLCRCKCAEKISKAEYEKIFSDFKNLANHNEENIYLRGCIRSTDYAIKVRTQDPFLSIACLLKTNL